MKLTAERMREGGVFVVSGFCSEDACVHIRAGMDRGVASHAQIYAGGYCVDEAVRRAFEVEVDADIVEEMQRSIEGTREQVAHFFRTPLCGEEGPGFLRYVVGGFYARHCDTAPGWDDDFPRRVSIVLFLTTAGVGCEGGSLRLHTSGVLDVTPLAGTLVAFPSDIPHEVLPVTAGVRDTIVDWFY
jgi:predicted 2-oxoglutarate/Fe(II)-dependent dioxygenase YbiX